MTTTLCKNDLFFIFYQVVNWSFSLSKVKQYKVLFYWMTRLFMAIKQQNRSLFYGKRLCLYKIKSIYVVKIA